MCYKFRLLDKTADRKGFDCGDDKLNRYLREIVSQDEKRGLAKCYICCKENEPYRIVGFFTLSSSCVYREMLPDEINKIKKKHIAYDSVPVILIGRLAVDTEYQGKGIGILILIHALKIASEISRKVGVLAVMVDAKSNEVVEFYKRFGFESLPENPKRLVVSIKYINENFTVGGVDI